VEVADDGPGFASDILTHLGEPYTSSRSSRDSQKNDEFGLGLGFFIARTLLQRSGANVSARNLKKYEIVSESEATTYSILNAQHLVIEENAVVNLESILK